MENYLTIYAVSCDETILYAAEELRRCLRMMAPDAGYIHISRRAAGVAEDNGGEALCDIAEDCGDAPDISINAGAANRMSDGIYIGFLSDFGLPDDGCDPSMDDILHIDVKNMSGVIAGSNPRSALAAVYRYLRENGCRWPRPGIDGELIPLKQCGDVQYRHKASYRHRGMCIEGAVSYKNMLENIEWAPKAGFNAYMLEFLTPYCFFENWYEHRGNSLLEPEPVSLDDVRQRCAWLEAEIKKRGMEYHAVGHAWTCEPFGISGTGWDTEEYALPDEIRAHLALVNGERGVYRGVALNTNLCYSNPDTRGIMVKYIAGYAKRNPHINYLHIWLADGSNNQCECDECQKAPPSDFYVTLLNELDAEFSALKLKTKLVFLAYVDLLWPPKTQRFNSPERFSLLFAPITRTYSGPYTCAPDKSGVTEYERNKLTFPKSLAGNIAYLREWQKMFKGDSFCYEYYFWLDHYYDPGYYDIGRVILEDVKCLERLGLDGIVSDQSQRVFMPTGFPMYVLGQGLYDKDASFDALAAEFYSSYGEDGEKCMAYMAELSALFRPPYLRGDENAGNSGEVAKKPAFASAEAAERLARIRPLIEAFRPVIAKNVKSGVRCVSKSWRHLDFHADLCEKMAGVYMARANGDSGAARDLWKKMHDWLSAREFGVQDVFDLYAYTKAVERHLE